MSEESIVFGLHAVRTLLKQHPQRASRLLVQKGRDDGRIAEVLQLAKAANLPFESRDGRDLDRLATAERHQGVCLFVKPSGVLGEGALDDLLDRLEGPPFLLVLDGVQDPHNLGACLRTANACGALAVVIPKDRAVQLTPTARKVAAGAAETTPLAVVTNLARTLRLLKEAGLWIVGTDAEAPKFAHDTDLRGPIAVVMGAEGSGLRQLTRDTCDFLVRLPQQGEVESLNVSVATGMLLYEALRQRLARK